MAALAVWSAITSAWSVKPDVSISQALSVALLGVSVVAIGGTFRGDFRTPAWALMLGSGVAGVAALANGPEPVSPFRGVSQQSTFLGLDQNALAFSLCLGLAASYYLIVSETRLVGRVASILSALLLAASILAVGSRTGGGVLIVSSITLVVLSMKSIRTAVMGGAFLLALVWVFRLMADSGVLPARLADWYRAPVLTDDRSLIIKQFWEVRSDWIFRGVGAGADADYLYTTRNWYANAHSAFWKTWIELGVVGLALWFAMLVSLIHRVASSSDRLLFFLSAPAIAAFFYTLGPVDSNALWALFGLAVGAQTVKDVNQA